MTRLGKFWFCDSCEAIVDYHDATCKECGAELYVEDSYADEFSADELYAMCV